MKSKHVVIGQLGIVLLLLTIGLVAETAHSQYYVATSTRLVSRDSGGPRFGLSMHSIFRPSHITPCTKMNQKVRESRQLPRLSLDAALVVPATAHCRVMCEHRFLSHWDITGRKPYQRYSDFAYGQHVSEVVFGFDLSRPTEDEVRECLHCGLGTPTHVFAFTICTHVGSMYIGYEHRPNVDVSATGHLPGDKSREKVVIRLLSVV